MKVILLNGSPRKNWNTHKLLLEAEGGAKEMGAETEIIHLYDLNYTDCRSCFACKIKGTKTNGVCAVRDDLRPVLEKLHAADGVIIGTPIYYDGMTGEAASLIHRMLFPTVLYDVDQQNEKLNPKRKKCGLIVTSQVPRSVLDQGYNYPFEAAADAISRYFGDCETLYAADTWQFDDYSRYHANVFDMEHKTYQRDVVFPQYLQQAHELGKWAAGKAD
jgi:multimeric flavodoxin WrbA